jgi:hypothetical protein
MNEYRCLSAAVATVLLAACSSAGVSTTMPAQATAAANTGSPRTSWMLPQASKAQTLLYVASYESLDVNVYDFKNGVVGQLYGQIDNPDPNGMCTDKSGDIWITSQTQGVKEYAHGGTTPIKTRGGIKGEPLACAVDPLTGDLAISVFHDDSNYGELTSIRIFGKGRLGHSFSAPYGFGHVGYLTYDNKGDLFVDGFACGGSECYGPAYYEPAIFELTKTGTVFGQLNLQGATLVNPTGLEWVNPTILVADSDYSYTKPVGYKVLVHGQTATVVATLPFSSAQNAGGLVVRGSAIVVPDEDGNMLWTYNLKTGSLESSFSISKPRDVVISQK